jgi:hypothetical protein
MAELLANRWVQLVVVGVLTALLGAAIGSLVFPRGSSGLSLGPVRLTTGGSVFISGDGSNIGVLGEIFEEDLPLTGTEAVAAGWIDPILCSQGRGKYFQKASSCPITSAPLSATLSTNRRIWSGWAGSVG